MQRERLVIEPHEDTECYPSSSDIVPSMSDSGTFSSACLVTPPSSGSILSSTASASPKNIFPARPHMAPNPSTGARPKSNAGSDVSQGAPPYPAHHLVQTQPASLKQAAVKYIATHGSPVLSGHHKKRGGGAGHLYVKKGQRPPGQANDAWASPPKKAGQGSASLGSQQESPTPAWHASARMQPSSSGSASGSERSTASSGRRTRTHAQQQQSTTRSARSSAVESLARLDANQMTYTPSMAGPFQDVDSPRPASRTGLTIQVPTRKSTTHAKPTQQQHNQGQQGHKDTGPDRSEKPSSVSAFSHLFPQEEGYNGIDAGPHRAILEAEDMESELPSPIGPMDGCPVSPCLEDRGFPSTPGPSSASLPLTSTSSTSSQSTPSPLTSTSHSDTACSPLTPAWHRPPSTASSQLSNISLPLSLDQALMGQLDSVHEGDGGEGACMGEFGPMHAFASSALPLPASASAALAGVNLISPAAESTQQHAPSELASSVGLPPSSLPGPAALPQSLPSGPIALPQGASGELACSVGLPPSALPGPTSLPSGPIALPQGASGELACSVGLPPSALPGPVALPDSVSAELGTSVQLPPSTMPGPVGLPVHSASAELACSLGLPPSALPGPGALPDAADATAVGGPPLPAGMVASAESTETETHGPVAQLACSLGLAATRSKSQNDRRCSALACFGAFPSADDMDSMPDLTSKELLPSSPRQLSQSQLLPADPVARPAPHRVEMPGAHLTDSPEVVQITGATTASTLSGSPSAELLGGGITTPMLDSQSPSSEGPLASSLPTTTGGTPPTLTSSPSSHLLGGSDATLASSIPTTTGGATPTLTSAPSAHLLSCSREGSPSLPTTSGATPTLSGSPSEALLGDVPALPSGSPSQTISGSPTENLPLGSFPTGGLDARATLSGSPTDRLPEPPRLLSPCQHEGVSRSPSPPHLVGSSPEDGYRQCMVSSPCLLDEGRDDGGDGDGDGDDSDPDDDDPFAFAFERRVALHQLPHNADGGQDPQATPTPTSTPTHTQAYARQVLVSPREGDPEHETSSGLLPMLDVDVNEGDEGQDELPDPPARVQGRGACVSPVGARMSPPLRVSPQPFRLLPARTDMPCPALPAFLEPTSVARAWHSYHQRLLRNRDRARSMIPGPVSDRSHNADEPDPFAGTSEAHTPTHTHTHTGDTDTHTHTHTHTTDSSASFGMGSSTGVMAAMTIDFTFVLSPVPVRLSRQFAETPGTPSPWNAPNAMQLPQAPDLHDESNLSSLDRLRHQLIIQAHSSSEDLGLDSPHSSPRGGGRACGPFAPRPGATPFTPFRLAFAHPSPSRLTRPEAGYLEECPMPQCFGPLGSSMRIPAPCRPGANANGAGVGPAGQQRGGGEGSGLSGAGEAQGGALPGAEEAAPGKRELEQLIRTGKIKGHDASRLVMVSRYVHIEVVRRLHPNDPCVDFVSDVLCRAARAPSIETLGAHLDDILDKLDRHDFPPSPFRSVHVDVFQTRFLLLVEGLRHLGSSLIGRVPTKPQQGKRIVRIPPMKKLRAHAPRFVRLAQALMLSLLHICLRHHQIGIGPYEWLIHDGPKLAPTRYAIQEWPMLRQTRQTKSAPLPSPPELSASLDSPSHNGPPLCASLYQTPPQHSRFREVDPQLRGPPPRRVQEQELLEISPPGKGQGHTVSPPPEGKHRGPDAIQQRPETQPSPQRRPVAMPMGCVKPRPCTAGAALPSCAQMAAESRGMPASGGEHFQLAMASPRSEGDLCGDGDGDGDMDDELASIRAASPPPPWPPVGGPNLHPHDNGDPSKDVLGGEIPPPMGRPLSSPTLSDLETLSDSDDDPAESTHQAQPPRPCTAPAQEGSLVGWLDLDGTAQEMQLCRPHTQQTQASRTSARVLASASASASQQQGKAKKRNQTHRRRRSRPQCVHVIESIAEVDEAAEEIEEPGCHQGGETEHTVQLHETACGEEEEEAARTAHLRGCEDNGEDQDVEDEPQAFEQPLSPCSDAADAPACRSSLEPPHTPCQDASAPLASPRSPQSAAPHADSPPRALASSEPVPAPGAPCRGAPASPRRGALRTPRTPPRSSGASPGAAVSSPRLPESPQGARSARSHTPRTPRSNAPRRRTASLSPQRRRPSSAPHRHAHGSGKSPVQRRTASSARPSTTGAHALAHCAAHSFQLRSSPGRGKRPLPVPATPSPRVQRSISLSPPRRSPVVPRTPLRQRSPPRQSTSPLRMPTSPLARQAGRVPHSPVSARAVTHRGDSPARTATPPRRQVQSARARVRDRSEGTNTKARPQGQVIHGGGAGSGVIPDPHEIERGPSRPPLLPYSDLARLPFAPLALSDVLGKDKGKSHHSFVEAIRAMAVTCFPNLGVAMELLTATMRLIAMLPLLIAGGDIEQAPVDGTFLPTLEIAALLVHLHLSFHRLAQHDRAFRPLTKLTLRPTITATTALFMHLTLHQSQNTLGDLFSSNAHYGPMVLRFIADALRAGLLSCMQNSSLISTSHVVANLPLGDPLAWFRLVSQDIWPGDLFIWATEAVRFVAPLRIPSRSAWKRLLHWKEPIYSHFEEFKIAHLLMWALRCFPDEPPIRSVVIKLLLSFVFDFPGLGDLLTDLDLPDLICNVVPRMSAPPSQAALNAMSASTRHIHSIDAEVVISLLLVLPRIDSWIVKNCPRVFCQLKVEDAITRMKHYFIKCYTQGIPLPVWDCGDKLHTLLGVSQRMVRGSFRR